MFYITKASFKYSVVLALAGMDYSCLLRLNIYIDDPIDVIYMVIILKLTHPHSINT